MSVGSWTGTTPRGIYKPAMNEKEGTTISGAWKNFDTSLTNIHNKLWRDNVINVKSDYEAVGDGVTDDTAAIQAAINAAKGSNRNIVFFPMGIYLVTALTFDQSVALKGVGWWNIVNAVFGNAQWNTTTNYGGSIIEFSPTSGTCLGFVSTTSVYSFGCEDLMLLGSGSGTPKGIQLGSGSKGTVQNHFKNVAIMNFATAFGMANVIESVFDHITMRGNGRGLEIGASVNNNVFIMTEGQFSSTEEIYISGGEGNKFIGGLCQNSVQNGITIDGEIKNYQFDNFWFEQVNTSSTGGKGGVQTTSNAIAASQIIFKNAVGHGGGNDWFLGYGLRIAVENCTIDDITIGADVALSYSLNCKFGSFTDNSALGFTRLRAMSGGLEFYPGIRLTDDNLHAQFTFVSNRLMLSQVGIGYRFGFDIVTGDFHQYTTNGSSCNILSKTTLLSPMSGATHTWAAAIPGGTQVIGVTARVTTLVEGATTMNIGDGTDADIFVDGMAVALNTVADLADCNDGTLLPRTYKTSKNIVVTAVGGAANFSAGAVRLIVHYIDLGGPTS